MSNPGRESVRQSLVSLPVVLFSLLGASVPAGNRATQQMFRTDAPRRLSGRSASAAAAAAAVTVPTGFQETIVFSGLDNPTSFRFSPDGRVFVGEKSGVIKVFASITATTPTV